MTTDTREELERWVRPGCTVALADGAGSPTGLYADLAAVAREVGGVRLILGWCPEAEALDLSAFADVRAFMPGNELRRHVAAGRVHYVPAWLSQIPGMLAGVWRPDVLVLSVRETTRGLCLGSEVSWIRAAARVAGVCLAEVNNALPDATRNVALGDVPVRIIGESHRLPTEVPRRPVDPISAQIGVTLASFARPNCTIQFGPGPISEAFLAALDVPVRIDSGILTDAVVDLSERGLLVGSPLGTYLSGTRRLYEWADGRAVLDGIEVTHDPSRLGGLDLLAINSALEIDEIGQVALDQPVGGRVAGIGGHTDYASAASRSAGGLSIIALPSTRRGRSTLVERLAIPVSTPRSVVDVVVTEHGTADLRGLTDDERAAALRPLFPEVDRERAAES
jgi:acyl-CoA hydrolase